MNKTVFVLTALVGLELSQAVLAQRPIERLPKPTKLVENIKSMRNSVVQVVVTGNVGSQTYQSSGSGFIVNEDGYIVTNYHVVSGMSNLTGPVLKVNYPVPRLKGNISFIQNFAESVASIVGYDDQHDLALLKVQVNPIKQQINIFKVDDLLIGPRPKVPKFSLRSVEDGEQIAISGYPLGRITMLTNTGYISSSENSNEDYDADIRINHGNSGGPAYLTQTGEIIGVASAFGGAEIEYQLKSPNAQFDKSRIGFIRKKQGSETELEFLALSEAQLAYNSGFGYIISIKHVNMLLKKYGLEIKPSKAK